MSVIYGIPLSSPKFKKLDEDGMFEVEEESGICKTFYCGDCYHTPGYIGTYLDTIGAIEDFRLKDIKLKPTKEQKKRHYLK